LVLGNELFCRDRLVMDFLVQVQEIAASASSVRRIQVERSGEKSACSHAVAGVESSYADLPASDFAKVFFRTLCPCWRGFDTGTGFVRN
jgi:hypothetical protein